MGWLFVDCCLAFLIGFVVIVAGLFDLWWFGFAGALCIFDASGGLLFGAWLRFAVVCLLFAVTCCAYGFGWLFVVVLAVDI